MTRSLLHRTLTYGIAIIWIVNGLFCKILNLAPRHELIVSKILGNNDARTLTVLIGISEVVMAIWILTRFKPKVNAIVQIIVIATMNTLEFFLTPELLLWAKFNSIFAAMLVLSIYYNEFVLNNKNT